VRQLSGGHHERRAVVHRPRRHAGLQVLMPIDQAFHIYTF
jgi:hypothetical protein